MKTYEVKTEHTEKSWDDAVEIEADTVEEAALKFCHEVIWPNMPFMNTSWVEKFQCHVREIYRVGFRVYNDSDYDEIDITIAAKPVIDIKGHHSKREPW